MPPNRAAVALAFFLSALLSTGATLPYPALTGTEDDV